MTIFLVSGSISFSPVLKNIIVIFVPAPPKSANDLIGFRKTSVAYPGPMFLVLGNFLQGGR